MKRTIPLMIAAVTGFVIIVSTFIPYTKTWGDRTMIWFDILAAVAFILGGGNLLKMNLQKISNRRPGWGFAAVTIIAFLITLVIGLGKIGQLPSEKFPENSWSGNYLEEGSAIWWTYEYMYKPLQATMFSLLAFFIASAAFRAFRAKNTEATILLVTAFVVLLGRTYAGIYLTNWVPEDPIILTDQLHIDISGLRLDRLTNTIMNTFNTAGNRAIMIGIAMGVVSTSLKVLLGIDRSYLGSDED